MCLDCIQLLLQLKLLLIFGLDQLQWRGRGYSDNVYMQGQPVGREGGEGGEGGERKGREGREERGRGEGRGGEEERGRGEERGEGGDGSLL